MLSHCIMYSYPGARYCMIFLRALRLSILKVKYLQLPEDQRAQTFTYQIALSASAQIGLSMRDRIIISSGC